MVSRTPNRRSGTTDLGEGPSQHSLVEVREGFVTFGSAECYSCIHKEKMTKKLKKALAETFEENDVFRKRVAELEASLNVIDEKLNERDASIEAMRKKIQRRVKEASSG